MRSKYILAGIISFLAALLFTLPADKALQWWGTDLDANIFLHAPEGGVISGSAAGVNVDDLLLDATSWRLSLLSLFKGRLGYVLDTGLSGKEAHGIVEFSIGGKTHIHNFQGQISIAQLLPLLSLPVLPIGGDIVVDIEHLVAEGGQVLSAEGNIQVQSAAWRLMRPALSLGGYNADLATEDEILTAVISNLDDAPVDAKGSVTLDKEGNYQVDISVRARKTAEERLSNLLHTLGKADAQGWYHIKTKGQL